MRSDTGKVYLEIFFFLVSGADWVGEFVAKAPFIDTDR